MTKAMALAECAKHGLTVDGPHRDFGEFVGSIGAPDGQSFGGQYRSISAAGATRCAFWRDVIAAVRREAADLCDDDRDEI